MTLFKGLGYTPPGKDPVRRKLKMRRIRNNYNHTFEMDRLDLDASLFI
jgi:hypothetical protein